MLPTCEDQQIVNKEMSPLPAEESGIDLICHEELPPSQLSIFKQDLNEFASVRQTCNLKSETKLGVFHGHVEEKAKASTQKSGR